MSKYRNLHFIAGLIASSGILANTTNYMSAQTQAIENQSKTLENVTPDKKSPVKTKKISKAEQTFFVLRGVNITGGKSLTEQEKRAPFNAFIGKKISVLKFQQLVNQLNETYLRKGLILSHAFIPPHEASNGIVKVVLVEGYLKTLYLKGNAGPGIKTKARKLLQQALQQKPLKNDTLEHALLMINKIPGISAKSMISPHEKEELSANLTLIINQKFSHVSFSSDNYLNRMDGAIRIGTTLDNYNLIPGSKIQVSAAQAMNPNRSNYVITSAEKAIGDHGDNIMFSYSLLKNSPNYLAVTGRASQDENGVTKIWKMRIHHPIIETRRFRNNIDFSLDRNNTVLVSGSTTRFHDIISSLRVGSNLAFLGPFDSSNNLSLTWSHGLGSAFGARVGTTSNPTAASRQDGKLNYNKISASYSSTKNLNSTIQLAFQVSAQAGYEPLLAAEEFSIGGQNCGAGYDPGELMGDSGYCAHSQVNFRMPKNNLNVIEWHSFGFYDRGYVKNQETQTNAIDKAASAGFGVSSTLNKNWHAQVLYALPLNHEVALEKENNAADSYKGRVFFSLYYSE